jgi:hypothetical protein
LKSILPEQSRSQRGEQVKNEGIDTAHEAERFSWPGMTPRTRAVRPAAAIGSGSARRKRGRIDGNEPIFSRDGKIIDLRRPINGRH